VLRRARVTRPSPSASFLHPADPGLRGIENTFCLTRDDYAFVSQHIGDMENLETLDHFQKTVEIYEKLFRIQPEIVAYDLHPEYRRDRRGLKEMEYWNNGTMEQCNGGQKTCFSNIPVFHHSIIPIFQSFSLCAL
jgi:hydrogenase maturation factor HypF (carbamoyltransferase family)